MNITIDDILQAKETIKEHIEDTPCIHSHTLSNITGAETILKLENLQFTGSFKDRGALVKLLSLPKEQQKRGVVAMSAGNHAQSVAYHAKRLNIPATIVMPDFTPNVKIEHTKNFDAKVILHGKEVDEAGAKAREIARDQGYAFIHPYDDPHIIAGQGTIAVEMLDKFPDLEILVVPIGGGGLIAGIAIAAKAINPFIKIIGVESDRYPSMLNSLKHKEPCFGENTIAEGIAIKDPGKLTRPIIKKLVDKIILVEEDDIEEALLLLLEVEKTVVEGAGAAALAAMLKHPHIFVGKKAGIIVSGGNIDMPLLANIIERGLARSGRMIRLQVDMRDNPGSLAEVTALLAQAKANVVKISHQRTFTHLPLKLTEVKFILLTRGNEHVAEIINLFEKANYQVKIET